MQPSNTGDIQSGVQAGQSGVQKTDPLIQLRGISRTFNQGTASEITVIPNLDLDIYPKEFLSIVGTSGSGKSTLMNIIGLLDRPTSGSYSLAGTDVLTIDDNRLAQFRSQKIGFVFQNFNLIGRMNALDNVAMPMMYAGMDKGRRVKRAQELLERVGMAERMHHQPNELSGGQKQRVAIARALANEPDLILADEPTGALDSATGRMVMDLFHELNQQMGNTIVFITHNPELAAETTRVVTLRDGQIISEGSNA